ncbi:MAG: aminotransferase class I/II-fold pyridoxal phosphate-dependent enzyme [Deltaproteobacteria bacterium]|nr:aminotransferase class I/II-fold pyridoxal phosphate-dependent enzyme [Deltaproteobacteria bacterium]
MQKKSKEKLSELSTQKKKDLIRKLLRGKGKVQPDGKPETDEYSLPANLWQIDSIDAVSEFQEKLKLMKDQNISDPFFRINEGIINDRTIINGKEFISYSSYNYVGLSGDPAVTDAVKKAVDKYGTSVSASRMVTGEKPIHAELEKELAEFLGVDDSIVFVGGHATNVTTIGHLLGPSDLILHDSLAHDSIVQGALLSHARRIPFPHNDYEALENILKEQRMKYKKTLIAIEGVYSVDGDIPYLPKFIDIKKKYKTFLMIDEAHSIGVLGKTGRGIGEHFNINPKEVEIWMGTLSKSFASCGGYIAGSKLFIKYLKYTAPGFMFSVGMSPANAAAAFVALQMLKKDTNRIDRLRKNSEYFRNKAKKLEFDIGASHDSAVIPVIVGNSLKTMEMTNFLFEKGINVQPILYPAVAENAGRLRFFITSEHKQAQMEYTLMQLQEGFKSI